MSIVYYELVIDASDHIEPLKFNINSRDYISFQRNKKHYKNFFIRKGAVDGYALNRDLEYHKLVEGSKEINDFNYTTASVYLRLDNQSEVYLAKRVTIIEIMSEFGGLFVLILGIVTVFTNFFT